MMRLWLILKNKYYKSVTKVLKKNYKHKKLLTKNKKSAIIKLHKTQGSDLQCADNLVI